MLFLDNHTELQLKGMVARNSWDSAKREEKQTLNLSVCTGL